MTHTPIIEHGYLYGNYPRYKYMNYYFEFHKYCGPHPLKKDGDPYKKIPSENSKFWDVVDEFCKLSDKEKEKYREM